MLFRYAKLSEPRPPEGATIVVVDDDTFTRDLLKTILEEEYIVLATNSGEEAIELCRDIQPDLVLLDVLMPGMNGYDICQYLKADDVLKVIPVMFVTSASSAIEENRCWEAGGNDFLVKPVNAQTLKHRVRAQLTLKFQSDYLRNMAYMDGLTGVYNRRFFDKCLSEDKRLARLNNQPLSLMLLDVDLFKKYNDHYGHLAGDDCLKAIADAVHLVFKRPFDIFARFGGEEFIALLPETSAESAFLLADKVLNSVRALALPHESSPFGIVTVSIGIACFLPEKPDQDPLQAADECLYQAKSSGRNKVVTN